MIQTLTRELEEETRELEEDNHFVCKCNFDLSFCGIELRGKFDPFDVYNDNDCFECKLIWDFYSGKCPICLKE